MTARPIAATGAGGVAAGALAGVLLIPFRPRRAASPSGSTQEFSRMPNDVQAAISNAPKPEALYGKLEDRILARDQKGASEVYYELVRERRPLKEIIAEGVRIHAPYTHVP